jgi:group I intron endonuclease
MESKTFIYKITNLTNGKIYIGKTTNKTPHNRWAKHINVAKYKTTYNHAYQAIHKAINKYGVNNFTFEIIEELESEVLGLEREVFWIQHYQSFGPAGYNLTAGGDGSSGFKHSEETKSQMSKNRKGTRLGTKNSFYGKHHSQETINNIKSQTSGRKCSQQEVLKRSKLTVEKVIDIREKHASGKYTIKYLAEENNVSSSLIRLVVRRKIWKDV